MNQVAMQALDELFIVPIYQTYSIIHSRIINKAINLSILFQGQLNGLFAFLRLSQLRSDLVCLTSMHLNVFDHFQVVFFIASDNNRNSSLLSQHECDGLANSLCAAGDNDDLAL